MSGHALKYAHPKLIRDGSLVLDAARFDKEALKYAPEHLRGVKHFKKAARAVLNAHKLHEAAGPHAGSTVLGSASRHSGGVDAGGESVTESTVLGGPSGPGGGGLDTSAAAAPAVATGCWTEHEAEDYPGHFYYFNEETQEVQWERPAGFGAVLPVEPLTVEGSAADPGADVFADTSLTTEEAVAESAGEAAVVVGAPVGASWQVGLKVTPKVTDRSSGAEVASAEAAMRPPLTPRSLTPEPAPAPGVSQGSGAVGADAVPLSLLTPAKPRTPAEASFPSDDGVAPPADGGANQAAPAAPGASAPTGRQETATPVIEPPGRGEAMSLAGAAAEAAAGAAPLEPSPSSASSPSPKAGLLALRLFARKQRPATATPGTSPSEEAAEQPGASAAPPTSAQASPQTSPPASAPTSARESLTLGVPVGGTSHGGRSAVAAACAAISALPAAVAGSGGAMGTTSTTAKAASAAAGARSSPAAFSVLRFTAKLHAAVEVSRHTPLRDMAPGRRADLAFVLPALGRSGMALKHVSPELRADRTVVLAAVAQEGQALRFAAPRLRRSRSFVLACVAQSASALEHAHPRLRADAAFAELALAAQPLCLAFAPSSVRASKALVLAVVAQRGEALYHASEALRGDKEVVLAAVAQCGEALEHASDELKTDREVVLAACRQDGCALRFTAPDDPLREDPEVKTRRFPPCARASIQQSAFLGNLV